ncbi:lpha-l-rhamnosidase c [Diaporthe amygdali]|uniref:lpha-l-rhamnosidase c n=1 Tax=Phomopsis amygdali TaxID=1214568 RepID=UPI0022FE80B7|nr:lpha-l-rhamnosidase c [Diaporthe amygdali]KAJ0108575.1 lpha-l-rhamnosidase c [Diaporthe amygdali]
MAESDGPNQATTPGADSPSPTDPQRSRRPSVTSRISYKVRSLSKDFEESNPPGGFMAATSEFASSAVAGAETPRRNSATNSAQSLPRRRTTMSDQSVDPVPRESAEFNTATGLRDGKTTSKPDMLEASATAAATSGSIEKDHSRATSDEATIAAKSEQEAHEAEDKAGATEPFDNGYHFPPSYPKREAFKHGTMAFLRYSVTPVGFCVVLYGLNVVAWGGMLFLLLCNASPAMCYPDCNDINSPRRKWVEYDSQVLTALFSLTGFGLAPWRFRDLYYLMKFRLRGQRDGLRRLAGIHRDWFRMPESQNLPLDVGPANVEEQIRAGAVSEAVVPVPVNKISEAPLTGVRAPATKVWKMDFMIWMMVWNTLFQCVLSGVMWGMNRFDRPSWSTGLFVALGCIVAAVGGIVMFIEGKKVKSIEGVPLTDRDRARLERDQELGIKHYNNIKDKPLKKEKSKGEDTKEKASS